MEDRVGTISAATSLTGAVKTDMRNWKLTLHQAFRANANAWKTTDGNARVP